MRAGYAIRVATSTDLAGIVAVEAASFGREAYDCKLFADYLKRCGALFLVAHRGREVAGYSITCVRGGAAGRAAELVSVAVAPAVRRRGVAAALLESTLRRLRRRGATRLHLVVRVSNQPAHAFYGKYGFRRVRVLGGYYEDGGDGILMSRPVAGE